MSNPAPFNTDPQPRRQDSLDAQLRDVVKMADWIGCCDAADWIRRNAFREDAGRPRTWKGA